MTKIDVENVKTKVSQNKIIGKDIFYFIKTKSTMDEAHKAVSKQIGEGSVFIAEEQTAGRGRFKRKWISDQGANLTFSILLKPEISKMRLINMATALAISSGIHLITGIKTTLKWPNDVRINKKKVAGILIESGYDKEMLVDPFETMSKRPESIGAFKISQRLKNNHPHQGHLDTRVGLWEFTRNLLTRVSENNRKDFTRNRV